MIPGSIHWNRRVQADISSSPTGHFNIIDLVHMEMLIVGNTGPLTTRSTLLARRDWTMKVDYIKPHWFPLSFTVHVVGTSVEIEGSFKALQYC